MTIVGIMGMQNLIFDDTASWLFFVGFPILISLGFLCPIFLIDEDTQKSQNE